MKNKDEASINLAPSLDAQTWTNLAFGRALWPIVDISGALNYSLNRLYGAGGLTPATNDDPPFTTETNQPGWDTVNQQWLHGGVWFEGDHGIWLEGTAQLAMTLGEVADYTTGQPQINLSADTQQAQVVFDTMSKMQHPSGGFQTFSDTFEPKTPDAGEVSDNEKSTPAVVTAAWRYLDIVNFNPYAVSLTPLSAPSGLQTNSVDNGRIDISWDKTDLAVAYHLYRDGQIIATVSNFNLNGNPSYDDLDISPGTRYSYQVAALDMSGEPGALSAGVSETAQGSANTPPTFTFLEPNGVDDELLRNFLIRWQDDDPDDNATIALYFDNNNTGANGTLITSGVSENDDTNDSYSWSPLVLAPGNYYLYAVIDDGRNAPVVIYSSFPLAWNDRDNDGLPDWWEDRFGGSLNPNGDPDNDGLTNREEYLNDSDPFGIDVELPTHFILPVRAQHTSYVNYTGWESSVNLPSSFALPVHSLPVSYGNFASDQDDLPGTFTVPVSTLPISYQNQE